MNRSRRFELWISGVLAVVCLALLNVLVWQLQNGPRRQPAIVDLPRPGSVAGQPALPSRTNPEPSRVEKGMDSTPAKRRSLQPQASGFRHTLKAEEAMPAVLLKSPEAGPHAVLPPQPKTITLEPLGYVEKADGRVEAIISFGEHVQVVHEGEILEDKFRVAKLSSSSVELVENSATPTEAPLVAEAGQGVGRAPTAKEDQGSFPSNPEPASNIGEERQLSAASAAGSSQSSLRQELGYAERADGRVEAIVDEGEHVRLAQATKTFASDFRAPAPPDNLELERASAAAVSPPDEVALESQPRQADSPNQEAGEPSLVASGPEPATSGEPEGVSAGRAEPESEALGVIQPEAMADYSGSRLGARVPETLVPALPSVESTMPFDKSGNQPVAILGYVEKAGGEKEGIVEVLGQVFLVHEGELFAEKYRMTLVTPSSVQILEELPKGSSELAEPKRDPPPVSPPVSRWRAPPFSQGSSGTDPPVKTGKAGELAAGHPVSTSRSPPADSADPCEKSRGSQLLSTGREPACLAGRSAQNDTCPIPGLPNTVGFVEKASGEMQAIVADQADVYLVPAGKVAGTQDCQSGRESGIVAQGRDSP